VGTYGQGEYAKFSDIKDFDLINKKTGKPKFSIYNIESAFGSPTLRDTSKFQFFKKKVMILPRIKMKETS
jgi:hypothetical protein